MRETDPRPFTIYRNSRGGPRWYQRIVEAWWVLTRRHSLHSSWQAGMTYGSLNEYQRLITNKAYLGEIAARIGPAAVIERMNDDAAAVMARHWNEYAYREQLLARSDVRSSARDAFRAGYAAAITEASHAAISKAES